MTDTMTDTERVKFLARLGLTDDQPALAAATPAAPTTALIAPDGIDPRTMPASEVVFDPALLDGFPDLSGAHRKAASEYVFSHYRSPQRDRDRHSLLHRRISEFIGRVHTERKTGGYVREAVKADAATRDLAKLLAARGLTAADLAALITQEA